MTGMTLVAVTLLLAWALSDIGRMLGAADYIAAVAQAGLPYWVLPAVAFVLAAIISFATGSSWGTFAIMFPLDHTNGGRNRCAAACLHRRSAVGRTIWRS